jgi:hypothetical protein
MFASRNSGAHLARGAAGFLAFALAIWLGAKPGPVFAAASLSSGLAGMIALRGCPICWKIGLAETLRADLARRGKAGF